MSATQHQLIAADICQTLDAAYGCPDLGNHADPVDELIYILLSTMTTEANYRRSFAALHAQFPTWEAVYHASVESVQEVISSGGLAPTKARLIKKLLTQLQQDWGSFDLSHMRVWSDDALQRYLITLPGIGYKAAACVMAYSFGRDICPVDTHTYRIVVRLGLIAHDIPELGARAHAAVQAVLPVGERRGFHINAIAHGRARCHLLRPQCEGCPVAVYCIAPEHGRYSRRK